MHIDVSMAFAPMLFYYGWEWSLFLINIIHTIIFVLGCMCYLRMVYQRNVNLIDNLVQKTEKFNPFIYSIISSKLWKHLDDGLIWLENEIENSGMVNKFVVAISTKLIHFSHLFQ
jgi:hypothetical protein